MSLFKVLRGSESNLPTQKTDGWAYFCTDTGSFWIDHLDSNNTLVRSKISANFADKLRYVKDGTVVELNPSEIATHAYVQSAIDDKADASHNHDDIYYTETEIDNKLSDKADTSHSHNDIYYTETEVDTKLDNKVDKVNGKGLSTNDYTTTEKNKLAGIEEGANKYVLPSATDSVVGGMKLYTSTGTNTAGTMTQKAITDALAGKSGTGHNHDSVYSKLGHTHTAAEVGATTQTYVDNQIKDAKSYTDTKVAELVDSSPETLNTLNELAAALGDDPNFATTMATELGKKATKDELTTHANSNIHITDAERTKWDTHADSAHAPSNAERNIIVGIQKNGTDVTVDSNRKVNITVPTKTSELTNNSDFATNASVASVKDELQANIDGKANSSHTHSYLPLSGGTIDGRLSVHGYGNNGGLNLDGYQGRLELRAEIGTASIECVDGTNSAALVFSPNKPANEGVKFSMKKGSTLSLYKLYGEHNKPTAQDIGAAAISYVDEAVSQKSQVQIMTWEADD